MKETVMKNKWYLITSTVFYLIDAAIMVWFSLLLGGLVDFVYTADVSGLVQSAIYIIGLILGDMLIVGIAIKYQMRFVEKVVTLVKEKLMGNIFQRGVQEYNKQTESYYLNLVSNDVDIIERDYLLHLPKIGYYVGMFIFSIVGLFSISWKALIFFLATFLIPIIVPQIIAKQVDKRKKEVSIANEGYLGKTKEIIEGFSTIIMNARVPQFKTVFEKTNKEQQHKKYKANFTESFVNCVANCTGASSQMLCIAIGGYLVITNEMTLGGLIAAVQLLNFVFNPLNELSSKMALIKSTKTIREKVTAELANSENKEEGKQEFPVTVQSLEMSDLTFGFENKMLYEDFNYQFKETGVYAIVGESGCGKSTLMNLLLRQFDDYDGKISINDIDIQEIQANEIYESVGIVHQKPYLFNDSIFNNITMYQEYEEEVVNQVINNANLTELIDQNVGMIGDSGKLLSGGERQRIALARVLLRNPKIIIFDEPVSALDPMNAKMINEIIFGLDDCLRIVITHDWNQDYLNRFDGVIQLQ